jgi:hypothetical protein
LRRRKLRCADKGFVENLYRLPRISTAALAPNVPNDRVAQRLPSRTIRARRQAQTKGARHRPQDRISVSGADEISTPFARLCLSPWNPLARDQASHLAEEVRPLRGVVGDAGCAEEKPIGSVAQSIGCRRVCIAGAIPLIETVHSASEVHESYSAHPGVAGSAYRRICEGSCHRIRASLERAAGEELISITAPLRSEPALVVQQTIDL